jgi:hypothetical protein
VAALPPEVLRHITVRRYFVGQPVHVPGTVEIDQSDDLFGCESSSRQAYPGTNRALSDRDVSRWSLLRPPQDQPCSFWLFRTLLFYWDTRIRGYAGDNGDSTNRNDWLELTQVELNVPAPIWTEYRLGYLASTTVGAWQWVMHHQNRMRTEHQRRRNNQSPDILSQPSKFLFDNFPQLAHDNFRLGNWTGFVAWRVGNPQ